LAGLIKGPLGMFQAPNSKRFRDGWVPDLLAAANLRGRIIRRLARDARGTGPASHRRFPIGPPECRDQVSHRSHLERRVRSCPTRYRRARLFLS